MQTYRSTLPRLLLENARRAPRDTALREKQWGVWQAYTWKDYLDITAAFAGGLAELGLGRGDIVVLIGDNRPEWLWAELAIQSLGGVALGLYQDAPPDEIGYILELSQTKLVVAEDQEQVDKLLSLRSSLPELRHIVYHDARGLTAYTDDGLLDFESVRRLGEMRAGEFEANLDALSPDDPALIATTSGTTGRPKLAQLSHANLLCMAHNLGQADPKRATDEFVSFLPLAWMGEQMMSVASALLFGFKVNFPEEPDTVREDIREIAPHVLFSPPRVWENMAAGVRVKIMETTPLKRWLYNLCMPVGERWADARFRGESPGLGLRLAYSLAWLALFRALKDRLGFTNIRSACTGGAALGPDTFRFFHALGVNLKQIYGQTEIAGISCIHQDGRVDFTSVGAPIPETEIRISEEGEILSRSPAVFLGYYQNEKATAEALDDGWLRSGDAGYFDDAGRLVVIDRLKDVMTLVNGARFSPQFIENKVKFSPYVKEAVAFGRGREHVSALVCLDAEIAGRWAEGRQITYTTYQDLACREELYALVREEIARVNLELPEEHRVRRFALLYKELDADDGELTRTRKVRRQVVEERYAPLVEALFGAPGTIELTSEIVYQDGRRRTMSGAVRIEEV
ncbi:Long-chain-fatty-acid--CoA ligase FadD15 [Fundidesulfovibrio magnetotacticus]|uniref:Long-chain-fatty-acid--CoA ligase FadD15 n=1 Tax=Fundidesulfovibrio magnetotacticus TaxID=2730080 RepID=A0A6V8LSZ5_9BACT|nr:AMP-binding protein [Fundidesulfovibrio magnetotacticus]GFK94080.1 Long-chain-fatty-acid--CoA ligase FadD15 [Fundidesulfovibrio magnetotacticus]